MYVQVSICMNELRAKHVKPTNMHVDSHANTHTCRQVTAWHIIYMSCILCILTYILKCVGVYISAIIYYI